ncbi:hypothetical protein PSI23_14255 [Xenorhabdus sp. XENO-10]|uniref:Uncharacterized protein n=1 Tax=Xenorhabdus yunnanensis TaxID=3025878 RepID=A0ABT5LH42_9GAMM|nr:hypothetical protein [Xenorhabdus yunnanensis]MDC9590419.1 hypothetical protein [Xenorhabdus yunnanensis]
MGLYIVSYDGVDDSNAVLVSTQIPLDIDVSTLNSANGFLTTLENNALSHVEGLPNGINVTRIANVRIHKL